MPIPFSIADRMKEAGRLKNDSALARDLGITPQALSNYKKRGDFPAHLVIDFAGKHGLSIDALLKTPEKAPELPVAALPGLTDDEQAYIAKALKVLRAPDATLGEVFRHSLDALAEGQEKRPLHA